MPLLESENKYPDCLSMKLEAIPVTDQQELDLYLTLEFNQQWESLLGGRVKFGLKGGELKLKSEGGEFSLASGELIDAFCQVTTKDLNENPVWVFEVKPLKGLLHQVKLGTLKVTEKPCRFAASFEVSPPDISVTDAEGLWRHDISPNQHAVIERKLVVFLSSAKLQPYLSQAQLCYECSPSFSAVENSSNLEQLQELIHHISEAKTNDFLELAQIAALDLTRDFAGGNLLGANLSKVDLSGANLCRTNLRGADLTDADLSEANLSGAILSGADLSGAYLENADLSYTDLHRASLALANLGGADLCGANLRETNLSNANLSGANVKSAQFGNNPGLSQELKQNLSQRGAIFEDL
ncbi:pentapeptide repeat-containing protein [Microseira wollei]|uniref:Pentapeptide repeat protein n=1 Tax=Microseira wollei NIES-4236 TaxID=2530354 RepID=A0AAV3XKA8_9CYAN|nr:pentapeptide repeat-containing protein [Microseira wollei]GET42036.1 pentapeptide repeat protein [Microseira wollei NIES-4236]